MVVDAITAWRVDWVQLRTDQSQRSKVAVAHNMNTVLEQKRGGDTDATAVLNWLFKPTTNRDDLGPTGCTAVGKHRKIDVLALRECEHCVGTSEHPSCQVDLVLV